jgi:hypothetical protein
VAHPSKAARKTRTLAKAKRSLAFDNAALTGQLKNAIEKNMALASLAMQERNNATRLARLLVYVVAEFGEKGAITITAEKMAKIPDAAKLQEYYMKETDELQLVAVIETEDAPSDIQVVTPKIELVKS